MGAKDTKNMKPRKFSWFPKFSEPMEYMTVEQQKEYTYAMVRCGAFGEHPKENATDPHVLGQAIGFMEDIDNSIKSIKNGKLGGHPPQK